MYSTRRPGGGWTRVGNYSSDYGSVISNYASAIKAAQEESNATELQSKIFNYKNGLLSYTDLKSFLNSRLSTELPGSQRELSMREMMVDVDDYENRKNKAIERSKMEMEFAKDGISAAERVQIEQSLLKHFKEGTPEYTEQLSTIATAKELERTESKNSKIARIEGQLADDTLSTGDRIGLYKEIQGSLDRNSDEYTKVQSQINNLESVKDQEEKDQQKLDLISRLYEEYTPGGFTNEEKLSVNQELLKLSKPGTQEYISLKESEAEILGAIQSEQESGGGRGDKEKERAAGIELARLESEKDILEEKFSMGKISQEDYISSLNSIIANEADLAEGIPDAFSEQGLGELQTRIKQLTELSNKVKSGQTVVVKTRSREDGVLKQVLVPVEEAGAYADIYDVTDEGNVDEFGGVTDESGLTQEKVVTLVVNGKEQKFIVGEDGSFEAVKGNAKKLDGGSSFIRSGNKSKTLQFDTPDISSSPEESFGGVVLGASTARKSSDSSSSSKTSSSSGSKAKASSPKIDLTPVAKTVSGVATTAKNAATAYAQSFQPGSKEYGSNTKSGTIKPGAIPGTLDFGITEKLKVGQTIKNVAQNVKNVLGSLFKKR